ncbi:MAG: preprotein translocase subunit SecA [Planctomycetes bacterium]|nr:preprotein translocase subunit SecA [Planctomycetota bacterium]
MKFDFGAIPARIGKALQKVFGSANQREVARYEPIVKQVSDLDGWAKALDQDGMRARVSEWKDKVRSGKAALDDALPEIFAMVREAAQRTIKLRHFDVQILGGAVLHHGKIAEMGTGEGKTLVATLPAALNALSGRGVYVVTVNDYLARRDRDWMAPIYEYLGLTVGAIQSQMSPRERIAEYGCDITYGTNNEFGFDYLRDNMKWSAEEQVQKSLNFAIVDEVDSILIDEARTPLIISGPPEGMSEKYLLADRIARQLKADEHFEVKLKEHQVLLNEAGVERAEKMAGVESFYSDPRNMDWPHHIEQALRAHHIYERDKDYVVVQNKQTNQVEVIIVDEFTGRLMVGRRWSDGLHQAVEVKEGIPPREENQTLATITLQNYFRMFEKLAGMTGTAMTEAAEFSKVYKLDVVTIPSNRPVIRKDLEDVVYLDENDKYGAIVQEIRTEYERGRPMLVGTTSIAKSEKLSQRLKDAGVPHNVLNAKYHEKEAEIIAQAGRRATVTVATNMAGRGTDIVLGGNPEGLWKRAVAERGLDPASPEAEALRVEIADRCRQERDEIVGLGGLYVLGTERHEARRIDNQLRGRCGRQGDPGTTKFFLCFDDDLMRIFARDWVKTMMERLGLKHGERIESGMVSRGIARAQRKVEARNFDIRKNLLEYDEVMDKQRKFVYSQRQEVLERKDLRAKVLGMFEHVLEPILDQYGATKDKPVEYEEIRKWLVRRCGTELDLDGLEKVEEAQLFDWISARTEALYEKRRAYYGDEKWVTVQFFLLLDTLDHKWKDHLHAMEVLKAGIGLRGFAQVDPKNEFKKEGYDKFELLKQAIAETVTDLVFKVEIQEPPPQPPPQMRRPQQAPDPVTAQAMVEALIAAGQAPPEIMEAVARGAKVTVQQQGQPPRTPLAPPRPPTDGSRPAAQTGGAAPAKAAPGAAPQQAKARPGAPSAPAGGAAQPAGPRPGRNDPCPCGSGIKYKKCCFPAFE